MLTAVVVLHLLVYDTRLAQSSIRRRVPCPLSLIQSKIAAKKG